MFIQIDERTTLVLCAMRLVKLSRVFPELGQIMNRVCLRTWLSFHILT